MDQKNTDLREQDAPQKNTDQAFVQVGQDGSPVVPENESGAEGNASRQEGERPEPGTLKDR